MLLIIAAWYEMGFRRKGAVKTAPRSQREKTNKERTKEKKFLKKQIKFGVTLILVVYGEHSRSHISTV